MHYICIIEMRDPSMFISFDEVYRGLQVNIDVCRRTYMKNKTDL